MIKDLIKEVEEQQGAPKKVGEFLLKKFESDTELAAKFEKNNLTLDVIWSECRSYAKKKAVNGCACIEDEEIYGVAIHVIDESKPMPEIKRKEYKEIPAAKIEESKKPVKPKKKNDDWSDMCEALF